MNDVWPLNQQFWKWPNRWCNLPKKWECHFNQVDFSWWIHNHAQKYHWRWVTLHGGEALPDFPRVYSYRRCFPLRCHHRSHQSQVRSTAASDNDRRRWMPGRCSWISGIWGSEKCMAKHRGFSVSQICLWKFGCLEDFWSVVPIFLAGRFCWVFRVGHFRWWVRTVRS